MQFVAGTTNVAVAGTRGQVKNTNDRVLWARFRGRPANTGNAFVGISDVSVTNGWTLEKDDDNGVTLDFGAQGGSVLASVFYVDVAVNNEKIEWSMILA